MVVAVVVFLFGTTTGTTCTTSKVVVVVAVVVVLFGTTTGTTCTTSKVVLLVAVVVSLFGTTTGTTLTTCLVALSCYQLSCIVFRRQPKQPVQQTKLFPLSSKIIAHMCENVSFSPNNVNGRGGTNRRAKARRRAKNAIGRHRLGDRKSCLGDRKSCNAYSVAPNAYPANERRGPVSGKKRRKFRTIN